MARKHLNILVAGGFDPTDDAALDVPSEEIAEFGSELGREIASQGHNLITGCQTDLDKVLAESMSLQIANNNTERTDNRIVSYVIKGATPICDVGMIIQSDLPDWDLNGLELTPPEIIRDADVVMLIGGFYGTFRAANWARIVGRPIIPLASFGGASKEVYKVESDRFDTTYAESIDRIEYDQVVKSMSRDWVRAASAAVSLAEKIVTTRSVFVVMSFADNPQYVDLYESIKRVCQKYGYEARRVDESNLFNRIIPEIERQIRKSAFVIGDVSEPKANVFYELGLASGIGKDVILVSRKGAKLPFDIADVPVLFWDSFTVFEQELDKRIQEIGRWQGRK